MKQQCECCNLQWPPTEGRKGKDVERSGCQGKQGRRHDSRLMQHAHSHAVGSKRKETGVACCDRLLSVFKCFLVPGRQFFYQQDVDVTCVSAHHAETEITDVDFFIFLRDTCQMIDYEAVYGIDVRIDERSAEFVVELRDFSQCTNAPAWPVFAIRNREDVVFFLFEVVLVFDIAHNLFQ